MYVITERSIVGRKIVKRNTGRYFSTRAAAITTMDDLGLNTDTSAAGFWHTADKVR